MAALCAPREQSRFGPSASLLLSSERLELIADLGALQPLEYPLSLNPEGAGEIFSTTSSGPAESAALYLVE